MKKWLRYLDALYVPALVIAAIYLFHRGPELLTRDLQIIPLALASLTLVSGLALRSFYWHRLLQRFGIRVPPSVSIASQLKPMLLKFIPGKVMSFAGRTVILAEAGAPVGRSVLATLIAQSVHVGTGLMLGAIGLVLFAGGDLRTVGLVLLVLLCLPVAATTVALPVPTSLRVLHIRGREIRVPAHFPPTWDLMLLSTICWLVIGGAFWLFFIALGLAPGVVALLFQPAANSIGILAIFTPSGLGVREAVGVWYLSVAGISPQAGIPAMILARFWTVAIEVMMVALGVVFHRHARRSAAPAHRDA